MTPLNSSNLCAVGYNPFAGTLTIAFRSGGVYGYFRVPPAVYLGLLRAESHGSYFHANIKYRYPYRRLR
jgi:hypothetical protein